METKIVRLVNLQQGVCELSKTHFIQMKLVLGEETFFTSGENFYADTMGIKTAVIVVGQAVLKNFKMTGEMSTHMRTFGSGGVKKFRQQNFVGSIFLLSRMNTAKLKKFRH